MMSAVVLAVLHEVFVFMDHWGLWFLFFYYTALTVPSIVGMASFKNLDATRKIVEVEMQQNGIQHVAPMGNQMGFNQYADVPAASPDLNQ